MGDGLDDGRGEAREGEIARAAILLGDPRELAGQRRHLARQAPAHDRALAGEDVVGEARLIAGRALVKRGERRLGALVHPEPVEQRAVLVTCRPVNGPVGREVLARREDLLDHHEERFAAIPGARPRIAGRGLGRGGAGQRVAGARLELGEVEGGIVEAVGVIEAQAVEAPLFDQAKEELVGVVEDAVLLHAHGGEIVDLEEATIVDLLGGHAPEAQAIALLAQERVEGVEAPRIAVLPVHLGDGGVDGLAHLIAGPTGLVEAPLDHLLLAGALLPSL